MVSFPPLSVKSVQSLPLNLVVEVEVALVEVVDTDVTVLTSTSVGAASRVSGNGVEGTEVATDTANLVFEDLVVESSLESTLATGSGGDFHGGLTTSEDDKVLLGGNGGAVKGSVCRVCLKGGEIASRDELGSLVSASSDEVGPVG